MAQLSMFLPKSSWTPPKELPDLTNANVISLDVETSDPNLMTMGPGGVRHDGKLVGISVATDTGFVGYFPIAHEGGDNLNRDAVLSWARQTFSGSQPKVGANLLYDLEWLRSEGVQVNGPLRDIQVAEPLLDEERASGYSLSSLAKSYLGVDKNEDLLRDAAKAHGVDPKGGLWKLPARYVGPYAEADAELPLQIWKLQEQKLKDQNLWEIFELESRLINMVLDMRFKGVRIDVDRAAELNDQCLSDEVVLLDGLRKTAGMAVEPWASAEIAKAMDKLGIWYPRTQAGNPSFTSDWLNNHEHSFCTQLAEYRRINKMRRDFIEGICLKMQYNGRIHAQFHALRRDSDGTRSGRFSSSSPNLQQIPARDEYWGPLIRGLFLPDEGKQWACLDYSQQEPRVLLHYAYLRKLRGADESVDMFNNDRETDFHQMVADMAGISRKQAKVINLGMFYGMGVFKLAQQLDMEQADAKLLFEQYHSRVPFVRQLAHQCTQAAAQRGQIRTLLGRVRHFNMFEPADSRNTWPNREQPRALESAQDVWKGRPLRRSFTHKALNALIQGSSADMTKKAMLDLYDEGFVPHITVHDELDFSVESRKEAEMFAEIMESCVDISVPLKVDVELGPNWGDIK
jgi:DNA polymerase I-like protein with 3'-5' exonuclease and polymerase domains